MGRLCRLSFFMLLLIVTGTGLPIGQAAGKGRDEEVSALRERIAVLEDQFRRLLAELVDARRRLEELEKQRRVGDLKALNPEISVILDGVGLAGGRSLFRRFQGFQFREAEIALQSDIDPFGRAEGFFAIGPDGVEVEEAYINLIDPTILRLPKGLQLKAGHFKANSDKINLIHRPEQPMADLPLVHQRFFGEEGFAGTGLRLQYLIPSRRYTEVSLEALNAENNSFQTPDGRPVLLSRLRTVWDLSDEKADRTYDLGLFYAWGSNDAGTNTQMIGLDLTHRWRPSRQGLYRSLSWQNQILLSQQGGAGASKGIVSFLEYQFSRTLYGGARYDWAGSPDKTGTASGLAFALTYFPSEFQRYRLQLNWQRVNGQPVREVWLQGTWTIGVHRPHPF